MASSDGARQRQQSLWFLRSSCPVFLPAHPALTLPDDEFEAFPQQHVKSTSGGDIEMGDADADAVIVSEVSTTAEIRQDLDNMDVAADNAVSMDTASEPASGHPFMEGLLSHGQSSPAAHVPDRENKMLTENADVAYCSTNEPLVDLFT